MRKFLILSIVPILIFVLTGCKSTKIINCFVFYKVSDDCLLMGYIDGYDRQNPLVGNYTSTVNAIANEGYKFLYWDDGYSYSSRNDLATDTITVTYIAYFGAIN